MKNASNKITLLLLVAVAMLFAGCGVPLMNAMNAAERGDTKEMERLIAEGADVNARFSNGETPLHVAAYRGNKKVVELLIFKGADVNATVGSGWTSLHNAAYRGKKEVVELLISKGADVSAQTINGETPLSYAKLGGHTSIVSLLQNEREMNRLRLRGVVPEPVNPAEETAFTEAAASYRTATVKPALPEEARKFKVQAEFAVNKKDFEGAASRYKEALNVAPWWPEGRFNRALILGELFRYRDAIREMKRYLTLVPDAPNARAAQDKIYQWEGELK